MAFSTIELGSQYDFAILGTDNDTLNLSELPANEAALLSESPGIDVIVGLGGNDNIFDDDSDRILFGNTENDILDGGAGADTIAAGQAADFVVGGAGNDILFGNLGNDTLSGGDGNDFIFGGQDADSLIGENGNDSLSGDRGEDILRGGAGDDVLTGGQGNDRFVFAPGDGTNNIITDFEDGPDKVVLTGGLQRIALGQEGENAVATIDDRVRIVFVGLDPAQLDIFDFTRS
ncbi:calcium-binding protein [Baaleninema sp.]|uniref:calcium-binding protein n=1 Tax=Baaleninema sp. TaxID=3101197 RepID=UPI003CFF99A9